MECLEIKVLQPIWLLKRSYRLLDLTLLSLLCTQNYRSKVVFFFCFRIILPEVDLRMAGRLFCLSDDLLSLNSSTSCLLLFYTVQALTLSPFNHTNKYDTQFFSLCYLAHFPLVLCHPIYIMSSPTPLGKDICLLSSLEHPPASNGSTEILVLS